MRVALLLFSVVFSTNPVAGEESWWQFLGPDGNAHGRATNLPVRWADHENVTWKVPIHDRGWSSPVIFGNQVWMTTATADGHKLFAICVDKNTGRVLHDRHIFDVKEPQKITGENTYATPTPVIEKGRVFVHFGTYGTACLDTKTGDTLWSRRDLKCDHEANAGPASSPTIIDQNLVVHVDGRDIQYIVALDRATGKTVWKTLRSYDYSKVPVHMRKAYGMPGIAPRGDGVQLVSSVAQGVYAYNVSGKELWRVRHKGWSIAPRPVAGHGLVFAIVDRDHPELWAIRHDGDGDVTDSHIAWKETRSMPQRCTPILIDALLYVVNRAGIMTCLEAKTGNVVWKTRLGGSYSATPIFAKDRIYLFNEDSTCTIIRPGRKFEVIAVNSLSKQQLLASPAVDEDAFIVRTAGYLYRIETGAQRPPGPKARPESFVGRWDIGRPKDGGKPTFVMTLNADFTARKSHVPKASGKWQLVNGEARVVWSDGWRDIIRHEGNRYRKIAFRPGADFDSAPDNTDTADKLP
ncbi:MAG: outer membrane protein assembly factor BamB family protein [Planctomycetales bacterium]